MGYDLENEKGESTGFNSPMWSEIRWIGETWGWKPLGTYWQNDEDLFYEDGKIEVGDYHGPYTGNSGQVVILEDALAWAEALERALADPELKNKLEAMHNQKISDYEDASRGTNIKLKLWEYEHEMYENFLKGFIEFCKNGPFVIQ